MRQTARRAMVLQRTARIIALLLLAAAAPAGAAEIAVPAEIRAIIDSPDRSAGDRDTDKRRHPAQLLAFSGVKPGMSVLDVGSGIGGAAFHLARAYGARVTGVDLAPEMIALARAAAPESGVAGQVEFVLGDIPAIAEIRNASISISPDFFSMTVDRFRYDFYDEDVPMLSRIMVAEVGSEVVGFFHLYTDENQLQLGRVNLDSFHVHPDARNHGVGGALLTSAIETATSSRFRSWSLRARCSSTPRSE